MIKITEEGRKYLEKTGKQLDEYHKKCTVVYGEIRKGSYPSSSLSKEERKQLTLRKPKCNYPMGRRNYILGIVKNGVRKESMITDNAFIIQKMPKRAIQYTNTMQREIEWIIKRGYAIRVS